MASIAKMLADIASIVLNSNSKLERINRKIPESIALFLFILTNIIIKLYHEPWFDEAQSWLIARSASLKEIIFYIPHYEGHPPLWHLILVPFAKLGAPYEISINIVSLILITLSAILVINKSPFPRILRLCIPFTYFFFYQYGVISRVYSLMVLAFILTAIAYKTRNEKPFRFIAAMALLCSTSAYGIVICFGIAFCWLYEILKEHHVAKIIRDLFNDKRLLSLLVLAVYVLCLVILIFPRQDTQGIQFVSHNSVLSRLLYMVFIAPIDAVIYDCFHYYGRLLTQDVWGPDFFVGIIIGILFNGSLILYATCYKKTMVLIIPYLCFTVFSASVYFYSHHLGIIFIFLLFWFWVTFDDKATRFELSPALKRVIKSETDFKKIKKVSYFLLCLCIANIIFWNIAACIHDICLNYSYARAMSAYIKAHDLENRNIISSWRIIKDDNTQQIDTNVLFGAELLPYFERNIISNISNGSSTDCYLTGIAADDYTNKLNYQKWKINGIPEVVIGSLDGLDYIFADSVTKDDYVLVFQVKCFYIWKDYTQIGYMNLYVLKDTAQKLGLDEIASEAQDYVFKVNISK